MYLCDFLYKSYSIIYLVLCEFYEEICSNIICSGCFGSRGAYARYATLSSDTPLGISQGCPVISDEVMRKVDRLLKAEKKPVLLWIYD